MVLGVIFGYNKVKGKVKVYSFFYRYILVFYIFFVLVFFFINFLLDRIRLFVFLKLIIGNGIFYWIGLDIFVKLGFGLFLMRNRDLNKIGVLLVRWEWV